MTVAELNLRFVAVGMGLIGLLLGSFSTVVIYRLPRKEQLVKGRSECPSCRSILGPIDMVPVFTWLVLRGRCRHCKSRISAMYPLVELTACALAVAVVCKYGASIASVVLGLVCIGLAVTAAIDAQTRKLPNKAIAVIALVEIVGFSLAAIQDDAWEAWRRSLIVGAIAFCAALVIYVVARGGLGEGDVKFAPIVWMPLGWLGWGAAFGGYLVTALVAAVWAIVVSVSLRRIRNVSIPLGPALALGAIITILTNFSWPR
jgi:leader peptidase (prepilin peptidase)/N-methyltransferase